MLLVTKDSLNCGISRNGDLIGGLPVLASPLALDLAPYAVIFAFGMGEATANLRSYDIFVLSSNLDAAHLGEDPFANCAL